MIVLATLSSNDPGACLLGLPDRKAGSEHQSDRVKTVTKSRRSHGPSASMPYGRGFPRSILHSWRGSGSIALDMTLAHAFLRHGAASGRDSSRSPPSSTPAAWPRSGWPPSAARTCRRPPGGGATRCRRRRGCRRRSAPESTVRAVSSTRRCMARSPGMPNGWPKGNSTPTMRGARTAAASAGIIVTVTVGIPAASMRRASTGTLRQQSGQTGARISPSVPSSRSSSTMAGAVSPPPDLEAGLLVAHDRDVRAGRPSPPGPRPPGWRDRRGAGRSRDRPATSSWLMWRCIMPTAPSRRAGRAAPGGSGRPRSARPSPARRRRAAARLRGTCPAEVSRAIRASARRLSNGAHTGPSSPGAGVAPSYMGMKERGRKR